MKSMWNEPLSKGELDLLLHKFKTYLGSVSRAVQNKKLKEEESKNCMGCKNLDHTCIASGFRFREDKEEN